MKLISAFILLLALLTGCLKSDSLLFEKEAQALVLVSDSNWPVPVYDWSTPPADSIFGTSKLVLRASISSAKPLNYDVKVNFAIDLNALSDFNAAWSSNYTLLPEDCYSGALEVVIPAGSLDGFASLTVLPGNFDGVSNYLLPLTITSASDGLNIAENRRLLLFTLQGY